MAGHDGGEADANQQEIGLAIRCVVAAALSAMDHEVVDLPLVGVHQDRVASAADVVDRVVAGDQDRWSTHDGPKLRSRNNLQANFWIWLRRRTHGA